MVVPPFVLTVLRFSDVFVCLVICIVIFCWTVLPFVVFHLLSDFRVPGSDDCSGEDTDDGDHAISPLEER